MTTISFEVYGKAQPAGSKRAFRNHHSGHIAVVDANAKSKPWKQEVAAAANAAYDGTSLLTGPLAVTFVFTVTRPKSHYGTGKNSQVLKPSAPSDPTIRPDLLKLARGIEDALTGVLYVDDSQIIEEHLYKCYGDRDRVEIDVTEYDAWMDEAAA